MLFAHFRFAFQSLPWSQRILMTGRFHCLWKGWKAIKISLTKMTECVKPDSKTKIMVKQPTDIVFGKKKFLKGKYQVNFYFSMHMEIVFADFLRHLNSSSYPNILKWILAISFFQRDFCASWSKIMANINADILEEAW